MNSNAKFVLAGVIIKITGDPSREIDSKSINYNFNDQSLRNIDFISLIIIDFIDQKLLKL